MPQIKISSVLGGQAPTSHFSGSDQFRASIGIDPAQPIDDGDGIYSTVASGLLRPAASEKFSSTTLQTAPLFIKGSSKTAFTYVYDARGSAYTIDPLMTTVTAMADGGTLTGSLGNGMEYYDNYMYFAKNTDICRYGPLNSSEVGFDGDFWTGNLALTALVNTTYPTTYKNSLRIPNHPMCRHSDGRLYFGDVVGNLGTIHYVATTLTSVEGDTNNTSVYNALDMGYGMWPTAIETYGSDIAIAIYEGSDAAIRQKRAKVAFWDTSAASANKIVWAEFPDSIITAMKNVNGTLYVVSGNIDNLGWRLSRFIGGYTFEEIFYSETGEPCLPGAIEGVLNRVLIGSYTHIPYSTGCVYSSGLQKAGLSGGMFNVMGSSNTTSSTCVTAVGVVDNAAMNFNSPIIGWTEAGDGSTGMTHGLDKQGVIYNKGTSTWWSQTYRIGQHFKITSIRIPLAQAVTTDMTLIPKIYIDDGGTTKTLTTINDTNYSGKRYIKYNLDDVSGYNNFWLELAWSGYSLLTVGLPIIITFELTDE